MLGEQPAAFAADLACAVGTTGLGFHDCNSALNALATLSQGRQRIILLDEITQLAHHGEECPAELQVFINRHINRSGDPLIICGSCVAVDGAADQQA